MATAEQITKVLNAMRALSGAGICFYDLNTFVHYGELGEHRNRGHYCELCNNVRLLQGGRAACDQSDRKDALRLAHDYHTPFFFKCHMGMCELVLPLRSDNNLIGLIFIGQCRIQGEDATPDIMARAERLGGSKECFATLYRSLPELGRDRLLEMGEILMQYSENLIELEGKDWIRKIEGEDQAPLIDRIRLYIKKNYMLPITPGSICTRFHLNPSYLAREFKKSTGQTLTEALHAERIENAKRLLGSSSLPVENIALNIGFYDANYFSRVFKRIVGMPPQEYRASTIHE